jgi:hypothetical protein
MEPIADDVRVRRAEAELPIVRRYCETRYGARTWRCKRRVPARIEASTKGLDIRYVVTNIARGSAQWLYASLNCPCGQAENLIKLHKKQLAPVGPVAVHRSLIRCVFYCTPARSHPLRMRLIKVAARPVETASLVRLVLAAAHPEAALFASLARCLQPTRQ